MFTKSVLKLNRKKISHFIQKIKEPDAPFPKQVTVQKPRRIYPSRLRQKND
jgi:hypothetical protein